MSLLPQRSRDARNMLLDAALEFGANWRRDVAELAAERLPELDGQERTALVQEITDVRSGIESWVLRRWEEVGGSWSRADAESAETHVRTAYPWVDERNAEHAVSQATYYAWHG
ncbi:hypothetical protein [Cellulomonas persica]|nr:hypothetical protein [Cellulomonas persica]